MPFIAMTQADYHDFYLFCSVSLIWGGSKPACHERPIRKNKLFLFIMQSGSTYFGSSLMLTHVALFQEDQININVTLIDLDVGNIKAYISNLLSLGL